MFGSHVEGEARNTSRVTTHDARGYEMEINQYTSIVGDPSVGVSDKAYLGHFVNDGASLHEFDKASREIYSRATVAKCNAAHFVLEGAHMGTVATRAIKKGEEVFVSYEEGYWLSRSDSELTAEKEGVLVEVKAAMATSDPTESRHEKKKQEEKDFIKRWKQKQGFWSLARMHNACLLEVANLTNIIAVDPSLTQQPLHQSDFRPFLFTLQNARHLPQCFDSLKTCCGCSQLETRYWEFP
jgi:hypothetical protein